ncbi:MAG TPA: ABC transporter ATP-binding protein [Acetobacteraceae bacterium]|nr:ABC transporter ATP-binding protein [Rhodoferax sp.]HXT79873.1 ABC transporter ATP-binding protein [Acetobacteraceae bacterium]
MSDRPLIDYRRVGRRFTTRRGTVTACEQVNLTVQAGEFLAIVGPSGCGKSTLLNMAAGLLPPSEGQVFYRGQQVSGPNTSVGYMTQRDTLLPWRTVEDNVAIALELRGQSRAERHKVAHGWLARVGLRGFEKHFPAQLSGGMRRRVSLARTLAYEPETILMDEPFGALDAQLRLVMHDELLKLWAATGTTMVFVTHDLPEAITLADRVAVFSARPGHIRVVETVDLPRPRDVFRIRFDPQFAGLHDRLWSYLEDNVRDAVMVN